MYKKISTFIILIFFIICDFYAQERISTTEYIEKYRKIATMEMKRSKIPASITLAQGILESGSGNSTLAKKGNNHFGIKCHGWKGRRIHHDDDRKNECFRKYTSPEESFKDHSDFLMNTPRYRFLFEAETMDYKYWARGLKKAGYATNVHYARRLIDIVERYELDQYDKGFDINNFKKPNESIKEIFTNNHVEFVIVGKEEDLSDVAQRTDKFERELVRYNDLNEAIHYHIQPGDTIYIQPKRRKAARGMGYHRVRGGETMHDISQQYAIKLHRLYRLNRISEDQIPVEGERLNLRKRKDKEHNLETTEINEVITEKREKEELQEVKKKSNDQPSPDDSLEFEFEFVE